MRPDPAELAKPLPPPDPPGVWSPARRLAKKALAPVERFLAVEASSGIFLLLVSSVALVWANSPWGASYHSLWHTPFGVQIGGWTLRRDLHFLINDGLMTIFFFVVGLEIRREMRKGELSELRRAALPILAALGGMAAPALLFFSLNFGRDSSIGWGVPMATDIAFAVGVLALLGTRVPPAMRILLLTLAVIDDVGAIIVIAVFYAAGFSAWGLLFAGVGIIAILGLQKLGVRSPWAYLVPGTVVWIGAYRAGVHPTIAGVVIGLLTPVDAWPRVTGKDAVSPVEALQRALHGWVAFAIMPLFAFANAGVEVASGGFDGSGMRVFFGVLLGLVLGKPLGILVVSALAVRLRIAKLPAGIAWRHVAIVGAVAGIGFTMALFVAHLAFSAGALLQAAKLAVLSSSLLAALIALGAGVLFLGRVPHAAAARSETEAEQSTDQ
jgi:Na+:H+ antiporter, NhaA family